MPVMVWSMQENDKHLNLFLASTDCTNQQVQLAPDVVACYRNAILIHAQSPHYLFVFPPLKLYPDSMMLTTACVHATCRSTVHTHIFRWLAALRHKATSPLFPVYNVWGFLFSVSLHWLILWFCRDALDRPCAEMKPWSLLILCNNLMRLDFSGWVYFHQVAIFFLPLP